MLIGEFGVEQGIDPLFQLGYTIQNDLMPVVIAVDPEPCSAHCAHSFRDDAHGAMYLVSTCLADLFHDGIP